MQHKLRLSFLCLPFLAGCSYFSPSHDQKNFKADSPPPQQSVTQDRASQKPPLNETVQTSHTQDQAEAKKTTISQQEEKAAPETVISGNQPLHHISPLSSPDPTALENNSNPTIQPNGTISAPVARDDYAPALSARQQERQAAIKLRDSLERIQDGHANNSEEDRQLSELPSSQRKAMLEQLKQALAAK